MSDQSKFEDYFFSTLHSKLKEDDIGALKDLIDPSAVQLEPKCHEYLLNPLKIRKFPFGNHLATAERLLTVSERISNNEEPLSQIANIKWCIGEFVGIKPIELHLSPWISAYLLSLHIYGDVIEPTVEDSSSILSLTRIAVKADDYLLLETVLQFYLWILERSVKSMEYDNFFLKIASCLLIKISQSEKSEFYSKFRTQLLNSNKDYEEIEAISGSRETQREWIDFCRTIDTLNDQDKNEIGSFLCP